MQNVNSPTLDVHPSLPFRVAAAGTPIPGNFNIRLVVVAAISCALWVGIAALGRNNAGATVIFAALVLGATILFAWRRLIDGLTVVAYLAAVEPALRLYGMGLPYLSLEYVFIGWSLIVLVRNPGKLRLSLPVFFYGAYLLLELAGLLSTDSLEYGRTVLIPSLALGSCLLIAAQIRFDFPSLSQLLSGYVVGACSIGTLIAYNFFTGRVIQWGTESNKVITGGMGPNQLSFMLAVAAFLCLVLGDSSTGWARLFHKALAAALTCVMVLTFSRGGLYLLVGAVLVYYPILQRKNIRAVLGFLVFGLIIYFAFDFAVGATDGAIIERYNELTTTNRLELAEQGWKIFMDNPYVGVGTGNYYIVIADDEYFGVTSGAHNELIRAASEHGLPGLLVWILFALFSFRRAAAGARGTAKSILTVLLLMMVASTFYNGLKLLIQPLMMLIALSTLTLTGVPTLKGLGRAREGRGRLSRNPKGVL